MKRAGCAIRSVNASRKKRLSRDHGVKLLFARCRSSSSDDCKTRMMNLWRGDFASAARPVGTCS